MKPNTPLITPDLTVQQLLDRWPQAAPYFLHHRLACIGCPMAKFDTLHDVARNYHLNLPDLLSDLDQLLRSSV